MPKYSAALLPCILVLVMLASGCTLKPDEAQQQNPGVAAQEEGKGASPPQAQDVVQQPQKPSLKPSETATKIYLGLMQTGLKEAVVDVQRNEVVIGFMEDPEMSNEALAYYAFGLSAEFEPSKEKTSVLIFRPDGTMIEASVGNSDTVALSKGTLTDAQYREKVRWLK